MYQDASIKTYLLLLYILQTLNRFFINMLKILLPHILNQTYNLRLYNYQLYELYKLLTDDFQLIPSIAKTVSFPQKGQFLFSTVGGIVNFE